MSNTTLNWEFRLVVPHLRDSAKLSVLIVYILHANERGRAWPSMNTLRKETGWANEAIVEAKRWLVETGALEEVPYKFRIGDKESSLHQRSSIMQVTGHITIDGVTYQYLYKNEFTNEDAIKSSPSEISVSKISVSELEVVTSSKVVANTDIATATPAPEKASEQPRPPTPYQAFTGAIAEHMFGIDVSNKALVDAAMGRIGPLASAIRKTHRALMRDDDLTPTPEDVKEFVSRWKAEQGERKDAADVPLGANTVPPHWARLMAPNHKQNEYAGRGLIRSVDELRKVRSS